jgi:transposase-like protein
MTKAEQARLVSWRLKILQRAGEGPRRVAQTCRHFGISRKTFYILARHGLHRLPANQKHRPHGKRWQRYEKPQPGHRLQLDVKFLERIPGTKTRLYQRLRL